MDSWMVFGPFSLSSATWAQLRFRVWDDVVLSSSSDDYLPLDHTSVLLSNDGIKYYDSGELLIFESRNYAEDPDHWFDGWVPVVIDLTTVPGLGNVPGQHALWMAFRFRSGAMETALGTFLDDIQLVAAMPSSRRPISDDEHSHLQWALRNVRQTGGTTGADIGATGAWGIASGSEDIVVAVLDTGVDLAHEDLSLVPGYDAVSPGGPRDTRGGPEPIDLRLPGDAHGTACAGVIAANRDNNHGIAGIAPGISLMPIRIGRATTPIAGGNLVTETEWVIDAISWAVDHGARVLSGSWSVGPDPILNDVIDVAVNDRDLVMVFATGNYTLGHKLAEPPVPPEVRYPATRPEVIAVGASSPCDERASFESCDAHQWESGHGQDEHGSDRWPDVVAPGVLIYTTDISGPTGYSKGDYHPEFGGTSAAAPYVAGVAALILSMSPFLSPEEVKEIIVETAHDIDIPGPDRFTGNGRVDAYEALKEVRARRERLEPRESEPWQWRRTPIE